MTSGSFPQVVKYVLEHAACQTISQEEVEASYKRLIEDYYDAVNGSVQ